MEKKRCESRRGGLDGLQGGMCTVVKRLIYGVPILNFC